ncbi:MAG: hypothetical protein KF798_02485 [Candidatus Paracaedibacteraceae bacterium]|nr:hypothetical protein [Candidatus Paracaedibacteraceae bacterium]
MHYRLLKKLSLAMCSLVMTLCSEVQSTQPDIEFELSGLQGTQLVAQTEADLTSTQTTELEKPSTSWASYLVTPLKAVSDLMRYAAQNPTKTAMISLVLVTNITAVAATCNCYCDIRDDGLIWPFHSESAGMVTSTHMCAVICNQRGGYFKSCR